MEKNFFEMDMMKKIKILCVFGQYQYGNQKRGLSTEYFSFIPAFEKLNYEIVFFDSWDRSLYNNFVELNQALVNKVEETKPDIIFAVQLGYEIWLETWDYIRAKYSCKTISWCTDDSWKFVQHSKFLAPHFDLMITTYEEFVSQYHSLGSNALFSSWACPVQWLKEPKKGRDCKYNVTFIGANHGDRRQKIEQLNTLGIHVECFGFGWDKGAIAADEIPKIFNDSVISLNFSNSSGENQIKARTFEVIGSGGFLLTENAKKLDQKFEFDNELAVFENMNECAQKIKYYLDNLDARDTITLNGYHRAILRYTYVNILQDIIQRCEHLEKKVPVASIDFMDIQKQHSSNFGLNVLKMVLCTIGSLFFGKERGKRFARRAVYEMSWRVFQENTFKARGIVGRMFYSE